MIAMKPILTLTFVAVMLSLSNLSHSQAELLYTVKKNDTVWGICQTYVNDPLCWKKLVEYNQLKNPKYLPPKSIIRIPKAWLIEHPTTALVIAVEGEVTLIRSETNKQQALLVGDQLSQQDVVKALNGSAMIKFADQSRLLLKANSTIRMANLQFYDPSQLVNTRVELLKGRVKAQVKKINNVNSRYQIVTPAAVAAVRGTEFRVANELDETGKSVMRTELLSGALLMESDINQRDLLPSQAVMAIEGQGLGEVVELLPRPLLDLNSSQSFALPFNLQWQPIKGAIAYKISLMTEQGQVWEKETQEPKLEITDIAQGDYKILIRGIDAQGFEGRNRQLVLTLDEDSNQQEKVLNKTINKVQK
jgi:hypothetical protein